MDYFILRHHKTNEVIKIGRFDKDGLAEQFAQDTWQSDSSLYSLMFDGLLQEISEVEAKKIISQQSEQEKIAA